MAQLASHIIVRVAVLETFLLPNFTPIGLVLAQCWQDAILESFPHIRDDWRGRNNEKREPLEHLNPKKQRVVCFGLVRFELHQSRDYVQFFFIFEIYSVRGKVF